MSATTTGCPVWTSANLNDVDGSRTPSSHSSTILRAPYATEQQLEWAWHPQPPTKVHEALLASNYIAAQQPTAEPMNGFPATVMYGPYYKRDEGDLENGPTASACFVEPSEVV